jgi:UDP-N-acetylglucosamine--N-acetylmuramyl-(pentapeptide) pyrophosphoryl-undecaprenol N-acetylglucosamine transferase
MGGYVCFPGGLMASLLGKPLLLVNADAALLLSNKALLPVADPSPSASMATMHAARSAPWSPATRCEPRSRCCQRRPRVSPAAAAAAPAGGRRQPGRQGAERHAARGAGSCIDAAQRPRITHQTGAAHFEAVCAAYRQAGVDAEVLPFIDDMAARLAACDLIVCRAGAVTVSELCAAGVASVLVPLVVSTTAHQRDNAAYMAAHGAAIHLPQTELTAERLAELLQVAGPRRAAGHGRARARPGACRRRGAGGRLIERLARKGVA